MTAQLRADDDANAGTTLRELVDELVSTHPMTLVVRADDERVVWASPRWQQTLGATADLAGRGMRELILEAPTPEDWFAIATRLRDPGAVHSARVQLPDAAGAPADFDVTAFDLQLGSDGEPHVVVLARPRPQDDGKTSGESLIDCHPDACIAVATDGFIRSVNPAAATLLAADDEALVDAAALALASESSDLLRLAAALEADRVTELHMRVRRHRGAPLPVVARVAPHHDGDGTRCGAVVSLRGCEEHDRTLAALERQNEELEHCVHSLAHDLRSPLVALLGFSRLLRDDYAAALDDAGVRFVDRIEQAGRTMEELIRDVLELASIGQPGEHLAVLDARSVLVQIAAELKPRLEEGGIELTLPESPPMVYCDRTRLYQVFSNLIGNAVEHMGAGDDRRIAVAIDDADGVHHIRVRDTGCGIAAEHHERIFESFQSLAGRRDGRRATGMGLAIVRRVAETRGGRAWVESEPGGGACFHVTLRQP